MRMILIPFLLLSLTAACQETNSSEASTQESTTTAGKAELVFSGQEFSPATPVTSLELASKMEEGAALESIQVEGEVLAVCKMKGCWMTMPLANGEEMRVTFKDYGFFVPKDCAGQTAIIEGRAYLDTTSVEDLRHYAVDGGMTEEEAAEKYTAPEIAIAFEATGVALKPTEE